MSITTATAAAPAPRPRLPRRFKLAELVALHDTARNRYLSTRVDAISDGHARAAGIWFDREGQPVQRPDLPLRLVRVTKEIAEQAARGDALARIARVLDWNQLPTDVLQAVADALDEGNL